MVIGKGDKGVVVLTKDQLRDILFTVSSMKYRLRLIDEYCQEELEYEDTSEETKIFAKVINGVAKWGIRKYDYLLEQHYVKNLFDKLFRDV